MAPEVAVHAIGLCHPGHMEWTPEGRLLVCELGRGRITDVTDGGDFRNAEPFAYNLKHPAGLLTTYQGNRILVADVGADAILDITGGGDASGARAIYEGAPGPYGLVQHGDRDLCTTFSTPSETGVLRFQEGQPFLAEHRWAFGFPVGRSDLPYFVGTYKCPKNWAVDVFDGRLFFAHGLLGAIFDLTESTSFSNLMERGGAWAWGLEKPLGMAVNPVDKCLYVAERGTGSVRRIPHDGGDMRHVPPVVSGFLEPSCLRFTSDGLSLFVCDMYGCCVWKVTFR